MNIVWIKLTPSKIINASAIAKFEKSERYNSERVVYGISYTYAKERDTFMQEYASEDTRDAYFDSLCRQLSNPETF